MKRFIIAASLALLTSAATAAPDAFQASYTVTAKGLEMGTMTANLNYNGNAYTYQKLTKANGLAALLSGDTLTERSSGTKNGDELIPSSYLYRHQNKRKDKQDTFNFVTPTQANGTFDGQAYQLTVPKGALDMATLELYLMDALATDKPLNYHIISRGKLQDYRLRKLGKETIQVPAGEYACEKVEVIHQDSKRQTTLWLSPKLHYAIVQVSHTEDGDVIETRLKQYQ